MKNILRILTRYLLQGLCTLVGITVASFLLGHLAPGDPAYAILASDGVDLPSPEQLTQVRQELGLDKPLFTQYWIWLSHLLRGNIGVSFMTNRLIEKEILLRLPVTVQLGIFAIAIMIVISVIFGFFLALHHDGIIDRIFLVFTSLFSAIPGFLIALILILIFAETLRILPTNGLSGFSSFILPGVAISLGSGTQIARVLRADLLSAFGAEYFDMARSKGFSVRFAAFKHALPAALTNTVTLWGNYCLGILGGSTIAESIFSLPGLGQWILTSINSHDYPAIQAYVVVMGLICLAVYLITDIIQLIMQPSLRRGE